MYVGKFKDGKEHGQGTYTFHDGKKYEGEFRDGKSWNGTQYDKKGNTLGKWVNGNYQ